MEELSFGGGTGSVRCPSLLGTPLPSSPSASPASPAVITSRGLAFPWEKGIPGWQQPGNEKKIDKFGQN